MSPKTDLFWCFWC